MVSVWQEFGSSLIRWFSEVVSAYLELRSSGMAQSGCARLCCTFYEASALLHGDLDRATWGFLGWLSQEWVILDRTRRKHCIFWSIFRSSTLASLQYAVAYTSLPSVVLDGAAQKHYYQEARIIRDSLSHFLPKPEGYRKKNIEIYGNNQKIWDQDRSCFRK